MGHHLVPRPQHPSCALRRRASTSGVELRGRPRAPAGRHPGPGTRRGDLPDARRRTSTATGATAPTPPRRAESGTWTAPDLAARAAARARLGHRGPDGHGLAARLDPLQPDPAAGEYVVSVLDSLGYKARFRAPRSSIPTHRELKSTSRWASTPGARTSPCPTASSRTALSCGVSLTAERQRRGVLRPGDRPRDRTRPVAPDRRSRGGDRNSGPRSTATSPTRRRGSPSRTASSSRSTRPASATTSTTPQLGTLLDQLWVR